MAMLSDPGAFSKGAEKRDEAMKGLGIEQSDSKAEEKKKKEEEAKKGMFRSVFCFLTSISVAPFALHPRSVYLWNSITMLWLVNRW